MALCIPSHVSLDRLPSASGLHLLFSGIFYIVMGPVVGNQRNLNFKKHFQLSKLFAGFVRDSTNMTVTLHCLNITTYICAISWGIEKLIFLRNDRKLKSQK